MEGATQIELAEAAPFALGPIKVTPSILEIASTDKRETLEPRIMQVFVALARRRGEVVSRDELIRDCWDGRAVGDDAINRCIARLRRLSEAEGGFTIETIPRVGYRLNETEPQTQTATTPPPLPWWRTNRSLLLGLAVLLLVVAAGGAAWYLQPAPLPTAPSNRVAVLPFEALSAEKDVAFFGDALAEQIIGVLNDNQVQPVSRARSTTLRKSDRAARALAADFVLDGTVQRTKTGLRITAHLDRSATHVTLWSTSFDQNGEDPVELQSQIAAKVVDQIKAALKAASTNNDAAISAYLKAQENARIGGRAATNLRLSMMRAVVVQAPNFSLGQSGLALSAAQLAHFSPPGEIGTLQAQARQAIQRALALDPKNSEAYLAAAVLATNWDEQERLFRQGLAINPEEPTLNSTLAFLLEDEGRLAEALSLQQRAALFDPLSPRKAAGWATLLAATGNVAQAHRTIEGAVKLWPTNGAVWGAKIYILAQYGYEKEALALVTNAKGPLNAEADFFTALQAFLRAMTEKTPASRAEAKGAILAAVASHHFDEQGAVEFLAKLGELDAAFTIAERAYITDGNVTPYSRPNLSVFFRPASIELRRDPRFLPLATRLGLMSFWKAHVPPDFCAREDAPVCRALKQDGAAPAPHP